VSGAKLVAYAAALLAAVGLVVLLPRGENTTASDMQSAVTTQPAQSAPPAPPAQAAPDPPRARPSRAIGKPFAGRLVGGVQLPPEAPEFFTWDPILKRSPNREWRLWGTDRLLATLTGVLKDYRALHPGAPRVGIGDLSRPHGGNFGPRFGSPGHASHQNGLDVDVYYPRKDGLERRPPAPRFVDRGLAQDLVDLFVAAGAQYVFVGPHVGLHGPRRVVQPLVLHDDHMHVRIKPR
jgi:murein endopeptidase